MTWRGGGGRHETLESRRVAMTSGRSRVDAVKPRRRLATDRSARREQEADGGCAGEWVVDQERGQVHPAEDPHDPAGRNEVPEATAGDSRPRRVLRSERSAIQQGAKAHGQSVA